MEEKKERWLVVLEQIKTLDLLGLRLTELITLSSVFILLIVTVGFILVAILSSWLNMFFVGLIIVTSFIGYKYI